MKLNFLFLLPEVQSSLGAVKRAISAFVRFCKMIFSNWETRNGSSSRGGAISVEMKMKEVAAAQLSFLPSVFPSQIPDAGSDIKFFISRNTII